MSSYKVIVLFRCLRALIDLDCDYMSRIIKTGVLWNLLAQNVLISKSPPSKMTTLSTILDNDSILICINEKWCQGILICSMSDSTLQKGSFDMAIPCDYSLLKRIWKKMKTKHLNAYNQFLANIAVAGRYLSQKCVNAVPRSTSTVEYSALQKTSTLLKSARIRSSSCFGSLE